MNEKISIFKDIIFHPSKAFKEINKNPNKFLFGAIFLGIINIAYNIYYWSLVKPFYQSMVLYPIYWIIASLILYFFSWFYNKKLKFLRIFTSIGYIATVSLIFDLIDKIRDIFLPLYYSTPGGSNTLGYFFMQSPLNFMLSILILFVSSVWEVILYFLSIKEVNKFKTSKALLVLIFGGIIILLITTSINQILGF